MRPPAAPNPPPKPGSPASPRLVVDGVGLITPLGFSAWETFAALLAGRRITDRIDQLEDGTEPLPLAQAVGGVTVGRHTATDPSVDLAERAAREAATEAGADLSGLPTWLGTSKGAVGAMCDLGVQVSDLGERQLSRRLIEAVTLGPHGYLEHHLRQRTGIDVRRHTVAACASSLTALHQACQALLNPQSSIKNQKYALVLTSEAALLPAFVASYRRLGVLAPMTLDGYRGNPLGEDRGGFVLAEVGAAVLLQRLEPGETPRVGQIELVDTAIATEAADLIRPSAEMAALAHVARQIIADRPIAALHPHATGTVDHDPRELAVLGDVLRQRPRNPPRNTPNQLHEDAAPPAVYANKGALGHTLGSAGLVSLVLACLSARTGKLPPMPWLSPPEVAMRDAPLPLSATPTLAPAHSRGGGGHAVFAAGFGGHVAGALVRRV